MLDFQSGVDDHLTGITHIIRGIDLQDSAKRQRFLYEYFDWEYPEVIHWGHVQIDAYDVKLSTSRLKELIEAGELDGWDDPRAPTIASVRRRGIRGEAVTEAMTELGTSTSDVDLAMSTVYAKNRERIDDESDRYFLVREGKRVALSGEGPEAAHPPRHPDHEDRGTREIEVDDAVLVEPADIPNEGERVWLKGLGCVRYDGGFECTGDDIAAVREEGVDVIHWVPEKGSVPVRLRTMEGDIEGRAEPEFSGTEVDEMVQFERIGFARVDEHADVESEAQSVRKSQNDFRSQSESLCDSDDASNSRAAEPRGESVAYFAHP